MSSINLQTLATQLMEGVVTCKVTHDTNQGYTYLVPKELVPSLGKDDLVVVYNSRGFSLGCIASVADKNETDAFSSKEYCWVVAKVDKDIYLQSNHMRAEITAALRKKQQQQAQMSALQLLGVNSIADLNLRLEAPKAEQTPRHPIYTEDDFPQN